jgi:ribose 5-phosphate isomerase B
MKIGLAADHGGFEVKEKLKEMLYLYEYSFIDFGAENQDNADDYPDYVIPLAKAISEGQVDRGVAICGSGIGAVIAANKIVGVRACLISDTYSARQGVEHDDLNLICLGGRVLGPLLIKELLLTFLNAKFSGEERHIRRLSKIAALERD